MALQHRKSVIPVLLTYFIDYFGFGIVFLFFGPLFLKENNHLFQTGPALATMGFLIFPLAQSLGAPIFGILSDKIGRKKTFLLSIGGTTFGNCLMGFSFYHENFPLLLIGRLLAGFFAGNLTLCLAALADLSHNAKEKLHNFSLLATVGGLSYICATLFGNLFTKVSFATPFWIGAILGLINIILLLIFFKETHVVRHTPFGVWKIILSITKLFKDRELNHLYTSFFFFMMSWVPSLQYLPGFLTNRLSLSDQATFVLLTLMGALWSLSNGILSRFSLGVSNRSLFQLLLLLSSFFVLAGSIPFPSLFIASFIVINIGAALSWTFLYTGISNHASLSIQGEVLGVSQALGSLGAMVGFGLQHLITLYSVSHYYIFSAVVVFLATLSIGSLEFRRLRIK